MFFLLKYFLMCAPAAEPKRSSLDFQTTESSQVSLISYGVHCFDITSEHFQRNAKFHKTHLFQRCNSTWSG